MRRAVSSARARKHLAQYCPPGSKVERAEHAKGSHMKVWITGVQNPLFISLNHNGRSLKNAQARIRRLAQRR